MSSLKHKAIWGSSWVAFSRASSWFLWLARIVILGRLLSPHDFGLFGFAFTVVSTAETLSQTGFQVALVQKDVSIEGFLDVAWSVQVIRGVILSFLLMTLAPCIATFFNEATVTPLLRILAFSPILRGFSNIGIVYFQKELEFHKQAVFQLIGTITNLIIAILIALLFNSVWALVFGLLGSQLVQVFLSYILHPYRPHLRLNIKKTSELYRFGRWIFLTSILYTLGTMSINIYIGRALGTIAFGYYQMAYRLAVFPAQEINFIINQVSLPVYVKLKDQWSKIQLFYIELFKNSAIVGFLLTGIVVFMANDIVYVLLGSEWIHIIRPIQILVIWGLGIIITSPATSLFRAIGRPRLLAFLMIVWLGILTFCMGILKANYELTSVFVSLAFSAMAIGFITLYLSVRILQISIMTIGKHLIPSIAGLAAVGSVSFLINLLRTSSANLRFTILLLVVNIFVYGVVVKVLVKPVKEI
jgi:O-antigen/teichoic acid export membrane protein